MRATDHKSGLDASAQFRSGTSEEQRRAVSLTEQLRRFLDTIAAAKFDRHLALLTEDLVIWTERLSNDVVSEDESLWRKAPRDQPPALAPAFTFTEDGNRLIGKVTFGRFHIGRGAAHGGAIGLVFDEVMGALAASGDRPSSRTAFLHVDFRTLTPMDKELTIRARFDGEAGRKRFLRATISDGDVVCAEAHGLWIAVKPPPPPA